jgi:hypothetical protein
VVFLHMGVDGGAKEFKLVGVRVWFGGWGRGRESLIGVCVADGRD